MQFVAHVGDGAALGNFIDAVRQTWRRDMPFSLPTNVRYS